MIKILVADDQPLMRDGLKTILELEEDMDVIGTAGHGREALEMVRRFLPDVVLLDIRMPEINGVECVKIIKEKFPQTRVIMLTTFDDEDYIVNALAGGADGYFLKDIQVDQLLEVIRTAARGQLLLPARVAGKLAARLAKSPAEGDRGNNKPERKDQTFSSREREVASLMLNGLSNRQIAEHLYLTEGTIKNYISVIYNKIGTNDRVKAIACLAGQFTEKNS